MYFFSLYRCILDTSWIIFNNNLFNSIHCLQYQCKDNSVLYIQKADKLRQPVMDTNNVAISRLVIGTSRTVGSAKKFVRITSGFGGEEFPKTLRNDLYLYKTQVWRGFQIGICTCSTRKTLNFLNFISTWHVENCQIQRDGKRLEW
jgi:hypothetical protein